MNIKRVLKAFAKETKVVYIIGETIIDDIKTVEDFMNNGLCTYIDCEEHSLEIKNDAIVIRLKSSF